MLAEACYHNNHIIHREPARNFSFLLSSEDGESVVSCFLGSLHVFPTWCTNKTVFSPLYVKWKYFYLVQNIVIRDFIFGNTVEEGAFLQLLPKNSLCLCNYMLKSFILSSDQLFFKATLNDRAWILFLKPGTNPRETLTISFAKCAE